MYRRLNITGFETIQGIVDVANDPFTCIEADRQLAEHIGGSTRITISEESKVRVVFDTIDMSEWDELSIFLYVAGEATLTVNGVDYTLERSKEFRQYLFDCSEFGNQNEFMISSEKGSVICLFLPCVRSARLETIDRDILEAVKERISIAELKYPFSFELSADVEEGSEQLPLNSIADIPECAVLRLPDGKELRTTDERSIVNNTIRVEPLEGNYHRGDRIEVVVPVMTEHDDKDVDPIILVMQTEFGKKLFSDEDIENYRNGQVVKRWLSSLNIAVAVDCKFVDVVVSLSRQLEQYITPAFTMLMDGEVITVDVIDSTSILETEIGNNPRTTYQLEVAPQPVTVLKPKQNSIYFEITSKGVLELDTD